MVLSPSSPSSDFLYLVIFVSCLLLQCFNNVRSVHSICFPITNHSRHCPRYSSWFLFRLQGPPPLGALERCKNPAMAPHPWPLPFTPTCTRHPPHPRPPPRSHCLRSPPRRPVALWYSRRLPARRMTPWRGTGFFLRENFYCMLFPIVEDPPLAGSEVQRSIWGPNRSTQFFSLSSQPCVSLCALCISRKNTSKIAVFWYLLVFSCIPVFVVFFFWTHSCLFWRRRRSYF